MKRRDALSGLFALAAAGCGGGGGGDERATPAPPAAPVGGPPPAPAPTSAPSPAPTSAPAPTTAPVPQAPAAPALALALPPGPLSVGCIGDSIVRSQWVTFTLNKAQVGNTFGFTSRAWAFLAAGMMGRKVWADVLACEGYSGYTTDQVARAMLPASYTVTTGPLDTAAVPYGVLARKPDLCFDMTGTNDAETGVSISAFLTAKRALWTRLLDAGILPVVISQLPRNAPASAAAQVPAFNAALAALCAEWKVPFVDVYTNCASGAGWKTGYDWYNGSEDLTGLHPGPLACQSMARDIAAQLGPYLAATRTTSTITGATADAGAPAVLEFGSGLFTSSAGWTARYDPNSAASVSVGTDALAQYGNALIEHLAAPATGSNYADFWGPGGVVVSPGERFGFFGRVAFDAGSARDALSIALQGTASPGAVLWAFNNGSTDNSGYDRFGASLPALDFYQEIVIPPAVTSVRPFITTYTYPGSGATLKLAQLGLVRLQ